MLQVPEGERLPFHYVMMGVKEGDKVPMWATLDDAKPLFLEFQAAGMTFISRLRRSHGALARLP